MYITSGPNFRSVGHSGCFEYKIEDNICVLEITLYERVSQPWLNLGPDV